MSRASALTSDIVVLVRVTAVMRSDATEAVASEGVTSDAPLRRSPLHDRHVALGARLAEFGGWEMPIQYTGVVEEHLAVRNAVGVFDVSHLGNVDVRGQRAKDFVNECLTNDLDRIGPGRAQYTLCCDDATGGVVDDLIVYFGADDDLHLVPNAANTPEVVRRLQAVAPDGVEIIDRHTDLAILAVQGPRSPSVLDTLGVEAGMDYMAFSRLDWKGTPLVVCRTGYTGEHGYELIVPADDAPALWDALIEAVAACHGEHCGPRARAPLRGERGSP